jgi:hypothetical protein
VFVLSAGPGAISEDVWRVLDVLIGGVVGLIAVFVYPPKPKLAVLDAALQVYRNAIISTLVSVGRESGSRAEPLSSNEQHDFVAPSRQLRDLADTARVELVRFVESVHLNLRARGLEEAVRARARHLRQLGGIGVQVRGIVGAANRLYDRGEPSPRLSGEEFDRLVDRLVALMTGVLGAPEEDLGTGSRERAAVLDGELEAELRAAAGLLVDQDVGVGDVLGSVSLIGRLDLVRIQLSEFRETED